MIGGSQIPKHNPEHCCKTRIAQNCTRDMADTHSIERLHAMNSSQLLTHQLLLRTATWQGIPTFTFMKQIQNKIFMEQFPNKIFLKQSGYRVIVSLLLHEAFLQQPASQQGTHHPAAAGAKSPPSKASSPASSIHWWRTLINPLC